MNTDIFIQNKYTNWYYAIVSSPAAKQKNDGDHCHHIIPESFFINRARKGPPGWIEGDPDHVDNIAYLSPREHFICHKLLIKMTQGKAKSKMIHGLQIILAKHVDHKMTGRQYELLSRDLSIALKNFWTPEERSKASQRNSGSKGPFFGKHHTEKNKKNLSDRLKGKTYEELYGEEKATELKKKVANFGEKNGFYNKKHSETSIILMQQAALRPKSDAWKESASRNRKGRIPVNKGKTLLELYGEEKANEIKLKQSLPGEKNGFYGKTHSVEQREKKSKEKLDAPKKICYYCEKEIDHMNYSRWHGENCKNKK